MTLKIIHVDLETFRGKTKQARSTEASSTDRFMSVSLQRLMAVIQFVYKWASDIFSFMLHLAFLWLGYSTAAWKKKKKKLIW